jgi:hypothetical protein
MPDDFLIAHNPEEGSSLLDTSTSGWADFPVID